LHLVSMGLIQIISIMWACKLTTIVLFFLFLWNSTSFEHAEVKGDIDTFWRTLGMALLRNAHGNGISVSDIDSAQGFLKAFQRDQWEHNVVLLLDEFDKLYRASEDVKSSCLETLRGIRNDKNSFAIFSVVAVGPFSILYLNSKELTTSPFNVRTPFQNPNFTREQVQTLYEEFMKEEHITIDPEIIEDIYMQTGGYVTRFS